MSICLHVKMIPDRYIAFLELVASCKDIKERRVVLNALCRHKKFIKAIKMICRNTVNQTLNLSDKQKNQLKKHAKVIEYVAKSSNSGRKTIVQNGGGFVSVLLPIVASLIGAAINGAST